jgi:signal transduction histidine kinase
MLMTDTPPREGDHQDLRQFFHDLATPLSGLGLHLERAARLAARGEDPTEALGVAKRELERAFQLFEKGREELLGRARDAIG